MKYKCVTIQMKALSEYFLTVLFTLCCWTVHVFLQIKGLKKYVEHGKKAAMSTKSQQTELS